MDVFRPNLFEGKVLLCTGGGSGICKVITQTMMKLGAHAAILGRNAQRLEASAKQLSDESGKICIPLQADVRNLGDLERAADKTVGRFGKIDFVVCGAAGNFLAPISGLSSNAFRTVIEIDTIGTYNTIKATLAHIRASKGSYVHISATLHYRGTPYQAHVSAAKAAVDALSKVLAVEEGPWGVRSNVIAPGPIAGTEGMERLSRKTASGGVGKGEGERGREGEGGGEREGEGAELERYVPLGRMGTKEDVALAAVWLFSDAASFVTGQVVVVDGASEDVRPLTLPYPDSVLNPEAMRSMIRGKL